MENRKEIWQSITTISNDWSHIGVLTDAIHCQLALFKRNKLFDSSFSKSYGFGIMVDTTQDNLDYNSIVCRVRCNTKVAKIIAEVCNMIFTSFEKSHKLNGFIALLSHSYLDDEDDSE